MTKTIKGAIEVNPSPLGSVFGFSDYTGGIYNPSKPYAIRFNCKTGQVHKTEEESLCKDYRCSIIKAEQFFGDLGKTKGCEWIQLFTVPHPSQECVPKDTVVLIYVKKESLSLFADKITEVIASKRDPATGVFHFTFEPRTGQKGKYYVVRTEWAERVTDAELFQLEQLNIFMTGPMSKHLIDMDSTREMVPTKSLDAEQIGVLLNAYGQGLTAQRSLRAALGEDVSDLLQQQKKEAERLAAE